VECFNQRKLECFDHRILTFHFSLADAWTSTDVPGDFRDTESKKTSAKIATVAADNGERAGKGGGSAAALEEEEEDEDEEDEDEEEEDESSSGQTE
jgi:hypothetical protein